LRSNNPPKPPRPDITPGRIVRFAKGLIYLPRHFCVNIHASIGISDFLSGFAHFRALLNLPAG